MIVTVLRSFTRFLFVHGEGEVDLSAAIAAVPERHSAQLPKSLTPQEVKRLLVCCDRSRPEGKRDYAILLLFARLGLRGGEVLAMTVEDIDWQSGELIVRGKGARHERLPLPQDVGAALVDYCAMSVRRVRRDASLFGCKRRGMAESKFNVPEMCMVARCTSMV